MPVVRTNPRRSRRRSLLPFVFVNMAITADGKIATANRAISSFGSNRDHEHLLELRSTADAVMSGARTVDSAKINLGPGGIKFQRRRLRRGLAEFNLRVVASRSASVSPNAEVFRRQFSPVIVLVSRRALRARIARLREVATEVRIFGGREIDLDAALRWLRSEWGVKRLLCEGGAELNDALFRAGLVNEVHLTVCPRIFGGRQAPTISDGIGFPELADAARLKLKSWKRVGAELFLVFSVLN